MYTYNTPAVPEYVVNKLCSVLVNDVLWFYAAGRNAQTEQMFSYKVRNCVKEQFFCPAASTQSLPPVFFSRISAFNAQQYPHGPDELLDAVLDSLVAVTCTSILPGLSKYQQSSSTTLINLLEDKEIIENIHNYLASAIVSAMRVDVSPKPTMLW